MLESLHTTGPVTRAIAAMRDPGQEAAITRLLTADTPARGPEIFGPDRIQLRAVSIGGLVSLYRAHGAALDVLCLECNTPRAENDAACVALLEAAYDREGWAQDEIVAELESRTPATSYERAVRAKALIDWHAESEDWNEVRRVLAEAVEEGA